MAKRIKKSIVRNKTKPRAPRQTDEDKSVPQSAAPETQRLLGMQQQVGNQAVNRILNNQVQREPTGTEEERLDLAGIGRRGKGTGHAQTDGPGVEAPNAPQLTSTETPDIQKAGPFGVEATINFTHLPPVFDSSKTSEEIQAEHPANPGVVAWAEPEYNIQATSAATKAASFNVSVQEFIDLASDYTGTPGQILRDHELGHDNIGKKVGEEKLRDEFETNLESHLSLSRANIMADISTAETNFLAEEQARSAAYDAEDYPRMRLAYYAAATPLSTLEGDSAKIADAAARLRNFNNTVLSATQGQAQVLSQDVITACEALDPNDLNMLQYNPEYKEMVETAKARVESFTEERHFQFFFLDFYMLQAATRSMFDTLKTTLDGFTWRAPDGEAA